MTTSELYLLYDDEMFEDPLPARRRERGKMPVRREARARAASKVTRGSRMASKRIARTTGGIQKVNYRFQIVYRTGNVGKYGLLCRCG